jgi:hypothetical protein
MVVAYLMLLNIQLDRQENKEKPSIGSAGFGTEI